MELQPFIVSEGKKKKVSTTTQGILIEEFGAYLANSGTCNCQHGPHKWHCCSMVVTSIREWGSRSASPWIQSRCSCSCTCNTECNVHSGCRSADLGFVPKHAQASCVALARSLRGQVQLKTTIWCFRRNHRNWEPIMSFTWSIWFCLGKKNCL